MRRNAKGRCSFARRIGAARLLRQSSFAPRVRDVSEELLTPRQAAARLGITVTTLYDWLGQSDHGLLRIRGELVTIRYFQGGPQGQGRIRIEAAEVERILESMRVHPQVIRIRRPPIRRTLYPGITVPLGRPEET